MIRKNVKNYLVIFVLIAFVVAMTGGASVVKAASNGVTFAVETTLVVGGHTLYVLTGGTTASYSIGASSVSFYMENGSSITVRSLAKKVLNTSLSDTYACASTFSMASRVSTATETFTITPTDTVCTLSGSGGGGGVTNSGGTTVTPTTETPVVIITPTPTVTSTVSVTPTPTVTTPQVSAPSVQITAGTPFAKRLAVGSENKDVRQLQEMLLNNGVYPEGRITGYFGALTKKAVQQFQEKYGIAKAGDPGYGDVGPNTRAKLNQILKGTSAAQGTEQTAVQAQLETQVKALQEQLVLLLAELAKQLQAQVGQ